MEKFAIILLANSSILLTIAANALYRAKDVFTMLHVVKTANLYIIPLILLAFEIKNFSLVSLIKILVIILMNIVFTILICDVVIKKATSNNISPDVS